LSYHTAALNILEVGWSTTIQDCGRVSFANLGVPRAGAVDRSAHDLANRLVGNALDAATLETNRGLVVEARQPLIVATSADGRRHTLRVGDRLSVDAPAEGMWGYMAVRGGIDVEPVLGSRSHDTLSGLGPPLLLTGASLPVGEDPRTDLPVDLAPRRSVGSIVRVWPGPRADWFRLGVPALTGRTWVVQSDVSRVGVRLSPGPFERVGESMPATMPSEGLVEGAIQITPSGEPIVMLANHPTTGGYPVIGVIDPEDIAIVAQSQPGTTLRFRSA
jgi:biotin-dependent carboxylase-like uncharacterized protein